MIRQVRTAEELQELLQEGSGYLYNDFGGRDPKMCPIHSMQCRWIPTMLRPASGRLRVQKLWADQLDELVSELERRGKAYTFCGSEPELAGQRVAPAASPKPILAEAPPRTRAQLDPSHPIPTDLAGAFHIHSEPGRVAVRSAYRLQFDETPGTRVLKQAIGERVEQLVAPPGHILEAVYTSASHDLVDAENVLLYNVGTGRFARSTHEGLRFERVYAEPAGDAGYAHRHDYAVVRADSSSSRWRRTKLIVELPEAVIPRLDASSKPDGVWLAVRRIAPDGARPHSGPYALELALNVGAVDSSRPADIVKPLIDGAVAGLHSHDGQDVVEVTRRLAVRMGLNIEATSALLHDATRAWLGSRRLLWRRSAGLQWNPGDDTCVSAELHVRRRGSGDWRLRVRLHAVEAL